MNKTLLLASDFADTVPQAMKMVDEAIVFNAEDKRFSVVEPVKGVNLAVIPVHGYLAHRVDAAVGGWFTGYSFIERAIAQAESDPNIQGIVLDVNSGGGMVNGAFEAADVVANASKPVWAIVDSSAYSAAYLLASQADKIIVSKTGGVGSIGVVTMHVDMSKALDEAGYKVTMLYAGAAKVDGNPYEALGEGAKQRIMDRLEVSYGLFVEAVSSGRNMNTDAVRATEAALFQGDKALEVGLVDTVMSPSEAYTVFANELLNTNNGGFSMSVEAQTAVTGATATEERTRIQSILTHAEAEGRGDLANHLAFNTDMSADTAVAILTASPKAVEASVVTNGFAAAMDASAHPEVTEAEVSEPEAVDPSKSILASFSAATGLKI